MPWWTPSPGKHDLHVVSVQLWSPGYRPQVDISYDSCGSMCVVLHLHEQTLVNRVVSNGTLTSESVILHPPIMLHLHKPSALERMQNHFFSTWTSHNMSQHSIWDRQISPVPWWDCVRYVSVSAWCCIENSLGPTASRYTLPCIRVPLDMFRKPPQLVAVHGVPALHLVLEVTSCSIMFHPWMAIPNWCVTRKH